MSWIIRIRTENKCEWLSNAKRTDQEQFGTSSQPIKPLRFHHWSACSDWVVNMDHHCPWFNNWVGLQNWRYFLLFLFHLWISSIFMLYLLYNCMGHHYYYNFGSINHLAIGLHIGLFFGMGFFNVWQWYLWLKGVPQIEFVKTRVNSVVDGVGSNYDYGLKSWRDNLYVVFGTRNLFYMLLPSFRSLPLNGLEYTVHKVARRF